jgi:hypothetical protein
MSLKTIVALFLFSSCGLLVAQEIDSIPARDSLPSQTLGEEVITANRNLITTLISFRTNGS